jgi:hypothetical protein
MEQGSILHPSPRRALRELSWRTSIEEQKGEDDSEALSSVDEEFSNTSTKLSGPVCRVHQVGEFAPGLVVWGLCLPEALSNDFDPSDRHQIELASDPPRWIPWKFRYMVATNIFESYYLAAPIFTENGNGIGNVPDRDQKMYMSLGDHRLEEHANPTLYPVLETESMEIATIMNPKSLVMHTAPFLSS